MLTNLDILIPTRDRPHRLSACLASLSAQDFSFIPGKIKLYILDNGTTSAFCENETVRHLDSLALRGVQTHYLRRPHLKGIFWIRRDLYKVSNGDVVCYLDDDIVLGANAIKNLWTGIIDLNFNLAAGFLIDVDWLYKDTITFAGHRIRHTLEWLIGRVQSKEAKVIEGDWMEMLETIGGCVMFRREDFENVGAWDWMLPYFQDDPLGWGEDSALCVSLKSLGSAFVNISEFIPHFTPQQRFFSSSNLSETFKDLLRKKFGGDYPDQISLNYSNITLDTSKAIKKLNEHIERCEGIIQI